MINPNYPLPKYSVIILIYHRTPELVEMAKDCLSSVIASVDRENTEIILVDNGSTERWEWEKHVDTYVRLDKNMGISRGWNTGLKLARGKYKVILGDDTIVSKGFLEELEKCFNEPFCGVANVHMEHLPHGKGIVEDYKWYSGACFMLSQDTIDKVGYFNENIFPCNTEDWEYWIRVYKAGLKLYKNHTFSVQHKEGQTVHAPDLSKHTQGLLYKLAAEVGFDPTPVFCSDRSIYEALANANPK